MEAVADISYVNLALGYLILIIPVAALYYYRTGLVMDALIATGRMTAQLAFVAVYLEYIFEWNNAWINILWVVIMVVIASVTTINRSGITLKMFLAPVLFALAASIIIIDAYFLGVVIRLDNFFDARYFIPITGMLLGNCMRGNIIALNSYYTGLADKRIVYRFYLANGAGRGEALAPFMKKALQDSFNPTIASMAVIGLISLPGMMTGQILGGSSPAVAIKYQIMLMITIFVSSMITVLATILTANKFIFDRFDNLKSGAVKEMNGNGVRS